MKKILLTLIIGMFLISGISASNFGVNQIDCSFIDTFTLNETIDLWQTCSDCTFVNISSIIYPDGTKDIVNLGMTKSGTFYNYTFSNTSQLGTYFYNVFGDKNTLNKTETLCFDITPNGEVFTQGKAISYIGFIIILFFMFGLSLFGSIVIPWKHVRTQEGYIVGINEMRYVKLILWALNYVLLMFLFGLSYKFFREAGIEGFTSFFYWAYKIMESFIYPTLIATVIFMVMAFLASKRLREQLERGISVR